MAKQANSPLHGPWNMSRAEKEKYIKVTHENVKNAKVLGQIFYVITGLTFRGAFSIDPCFSKGWWHIEKKPWETPGYTRVYFPAGMDEGEYIATYKALFEKYLREESLYIKQSDPIIKFYKE
jgi:hypothetical protein